MDALTAVPTAWRGVPAWLVLGDRLQIVLTVTGCHLASLRLRGEDLDPLWQPQWPAADPRTVTGSPTGAYGDGPEAALLAGIVGSNLCLDRFGAPWPGEERPLHGEAGLARYERTQPARERVDFTAWLPEARLQVERHVHLDGTTLHLATTVRHLGGCARAVEWCEHTSLGGSFLDGLRIRADIDRVANWPGPRAADSRFPMAAPEARIATDRALAVPAADDPPCGDVLAARVLVRDDATWTAENPRWRRRLSARWRASDFPWLALWTQHRSRTGPPWSGRERVRGMELSTKPFPEGKPPAVRARSYLGRSTLCEVPPGAGRKHAIQLRWERME
ncbi:MAG: hypothetical protein H0V44_06400 [Planctomycetes bacterium]|nr:hypothetical protein [Planctomycetota bacterium]